MFWSSLIHWTVTAISAEQEMTLSSPTLWCTQSPCHANADSWWRFWINSGGQHSHGSAAGQVRKWICQTALDRAVRARGKILRDGSGRVSSTTRQAFNWNIGCSFWPHVSVRGSPADSLHLTAMLPGRPCAPRSCEPTCRGGAAAAVTSALSSARQPTHNALLTASARFGETWAALVSRALTVHMEDTAEGKNHQIPDQLSLLTLNHHRKVTLPAVWGSMLMDTLLPDPPALVWSPPCGTVACPWPWRE